MFSALRSGGAVAVACLVTGLFTLLACEPDGSPNRVHDTNVPAPSASSVAPTSSAATASSVASVAASRALTASATGAGIALPPAAGRFDYQLGGAYPPPSGVVIVSRDRTAPPVRGLYNICYINAFQTQPDEAAWWKTSHDQLLLRSGGGDYVEDPDWPGELLLDTSTAHNRAAIAAILDSSIDGCAAHGFQAVEPDNLDSWTRSDGRLTASDNLALATLLIARAHADHLAIAQKNAAQLAPEGRRIGFDFAVAEECQVYNECDKYIAVYGSHVLEIEYTDNGTDAFHTACATHGRRISVVLRDRNLTVPGDPAHVDVTC